MSDTPTLWPDDGRRQRARELIDAVFEAAQDLPVENFPYVPLHELAELSSAQITLWDVRSALAAIQDPTQHVVRKAERALSPGSPVQRTDRPTRDFKFFIPVFIVLGRDRPIPSQSHMLGQHFFFRTRESVEDELDTDLDQSLLLKGIEDRRRPTEPTFITWTGRGRSATDIWESTLAAPFNTLRGVLEFITADRSQRSLVESSPAAVVPHPKNLLWIRSDGRTGGLGMAVKGYAPSPRARFGESHFQQLQKLSSPFTSSVSEDTSAFIVSTSLQLYALAMDAHLNHNCFLALWQCLETLTLGPSRIGGSTVDIGKRANWIVRAHKGDHWAAPKTLRRLADLRNTFVHEGKRERVAPEDVNTLMRLVELILEWYLETAIERYPDAADLEAEFLRVS